MIDTKHPRYLDRVPAWGIMRDCYAGELAVKAAGITYLPYTSGQRSDGAGLGNWQTAGQLAYDAYKLRAQFPDHVRECARSLLGIMHRKDPIIELPAKLEPLRRAATVEGESLVALLVRINESQLVMGRVGLLLDPVDGAEFRTPPHIATYDAATIINWGDSTAAPPWIVLDESGPVATGYQWHDERRFRVLELADGLYRISRPLQAPPGEDDWLAPTIGGRTLDRIPFVFVNVTDLVADPDVPLLLGLASKSLATYRQSADYHQELFMCAQSTLVIKGAKLSELNDGARDVRVGAGAVIDGLPADGSAEYLGITGVGLSEMRQALENDTRAAEALSAHLLDTRGGGQESGEALRIRVAARTASLATVARAGAEGLAEALRHAARWMDADPDQVSVSPNLDFSDDEASAQDLAALMNAKSQGLPLSRKSIHGWLRKREWTALDYDEELAELDEEAMDGGDGTASRDIDPLGGEPAKIPSTEDE